MDLLRDDGECFSNSCKKVLQELETNPLVVQWLPWVSSTGRHSDTKSSSQVLFQLHSPIFQPKSPSSALVAPPSKSNSPVQPKHLKDSNSMPMTKSIKSYDPPKTATHVICNSSSQPSQPHSQQLPRKLTISDVDWDNNEYYLRIFLPCLKTFDIKDVMYTVDFSEDDGSTQLTMKYPGHEFDIHVCKQILPHLEGKLEGRKLIIRLTKIYPRDQWSLLCSREYHQNGTVTFYINDILKKTLTLAQIRPFLPSSPDNSIENIVLRYFDDLNRDIFQLMLDQSILHEIQDKTHDSGYVKLREL